MARADNLPKDGTKEGYLIVLKPARRPQGYTLFDALNNIYRISWIQGTIVGVSDEGSALTKASSASLSPGEFYLDEVDDFFYIRLSDNTDPDLRVIVCEYELYCGTVDAHAPRVPTDANETVVYYEPIVRIEPTLKSSYADSFFGFLPVQSSRLVITNGEHLFEKNLYDSSYKRRELKVYHFSVASNISKIEADDVKLVLEGLMGNVEYQQGELVIAVTDRTDDFTREFRPSGTTFYNTTDFPDLDPLFKSKPVRKVYGVVDGFIPVNVDYEDESPTTSDNRDWGVRGEKSKLNNVTTTTGVGSTGTNIIVTSTDGLRVGDNIKIDTNKYTTITAVNVGSVDVDPAVTAPGSGVTVERPTISRVEIIQNEEKYLALYDRDYTINTGLAGDVLGFSFTTSMESNLSIPNTLSPSDVVHCRVYGPENDVTLNALPFGTDDTDTENLTHPAVIMVDLLKQYLGYSEDLLDIASFQTFLSSSTEAIGFALPRESTSSEFPTFQNIFARILETTLTRFFLKDGKWRIEQVGPVSTEDQSLDDDVINLDTLRYTFDYDDVASDFFVEYNWRERSEDVKIVNPTTNVESATSDLAIYLHNTDKTKTVQSLFFKSTDAQGLADHLSFIFGDRLGRARVITKSEFFDIILGETTKVERTKLPGFEYDIDTLRERLFVVLETDKRLRSIGITLDDQKGIQDNSSSW